MRFRRFGLARPVRQIPAILDLYRRSPALIETIPYGRIGVVDHKAEELSFMTQKAVISSAVLIAVVVSFPSSPASAEDSYFKYHAGPCHAGYSYISSENICYCANCLHHAESEGSHINAKIRDPNTQKIRNPNNQ
jgi:hypothetical protein